MNNPADSRPGRSEKVGAWSLGATNPHKVIHRPTCRYAKRPYNYFRDMTEDQVGDHLVLTGAWRWHKAHADCCPDLAARLTTAAEVNVS